MIPKLKYFTVERTDQTFEDVRRKMRRELGELTLYAYSPLIDLGGNFKVLELKPAMDVSLTVKVDGPEFLIKELQRYFINGGKL